MSNERITSIGLSNFAQTELIRAVTERGASIRMRVCGLSMWPFIRDGDILTIAPVDGRGPRVGQVVAFIRPDTGRGAIHRAIAAEGEGWLIRGDNSPEPDGIVTREHVFGVVTCVERGGRRVRLGLGTERALVAVLSRANVLLGMKALRYLPRRAVGLALRRIQAVSLYRSLGKRLTPPIAVAVAREDDLDAVHRLFNPSEQYGAVPPHSKATTWVARRGEKVVGVAELVRHPQEDFPWVGHWLKSLHVWGRYRGLGIGETLTRRAIAQAASEDAAELLLAVFEDDGRAISLYRKLGFEPVSLSALEPEFASDEQEYGRRRIVMRTRLTAGD